MGLLQFINFEIWNARDNFQIDNEKLSKRKCQFSEQLKLCHLEKTDKGN